MTGPTAPQTLDAFSARIRAAVAEIGMVVVRPDYGQDRMAELSEQVAILDQIVEEAFAAGVAAQPPRDCYVPVQVPWRRVRARDVVVDYPAESYGDPDEAGDPAGSHGEPDLWAVERSGWVIDLDSRERAWGLTVNGLGRQRIAADPDDRIDVLVRSDLHDAVALTGEQLGARLIATRTSQDGTTDGDPAWRAEDGHRQGTTTTIGGP